MNHLGYEGDWHEEHEVPIKEDVPAKLNKEEGNGGVDKDILEVTVTYMGDALSFENGTTVSIGLLQVSIYYQIDLFMMMEGRKDPDIPLHDVSQFDVISLRALFSMYGIY